MPTTTPFNNLITFSRGSNATVTGPNGLIQWAPNNLVAFSEQFDNAAWNKANATVTANSTVAPDGTTTADAMAAASTGTFRYARQPITLTSGITYTLTMYFKYKTARWVWLLGETNADAFAVFDVLNGVVGSATAGVAHSIIPAGNGWYRCTATFTVSSATGLQEIGFGLSDTDTIVSPSVTAGIDTFVWGAQLELGSTATTYNSTTVKNLLGFSEAFDNAAWTKSNTSIVTGAQANPVNGLFTAQKLMENTANSVHRFIVGATLTATPYTLSIYAKAAERNWIAVGNTSDGQLAHFNLTNGTVGTILGGATAAITNIGSGWYRCSVTFTPTAGSRTLAVWLASADNTLTYTGDGNSGVYIYGAQLSDSASLDPYVPTPGAAPSSTAFYGPRFDFDPVTLQPRGLLVEEQRTNLTVRSDNFADAVWTKASATITSNTDTAPDGTLTADTFAATATNGEYYQQVTSTSGTAHTGSIYVKRKTGTGNIFLVDPAGGRTLVTTPINSTTWTRISVTANSVSVNPFFGVRLATSGDELYVWGAQLEVGAFATSYIPTVASTVTRSADATLISGQNFAQWYRQDEGAFIAEFNVLDQGGVTFTVSDGTGNNRFTGYPAGSVQLEIATGGVLQAALDGGTITPNTNVKVASAYAANNAALSLNGGSAVSDASVTLPTVNQSRIGANVGGGNLLNGWFRSFRFIPARAADFQLQALST